MLHICEFTLIPVNAIKKSVYTRLIWFKVCIVSLLDLGGNWQHYTSLSLTQDQTYDGSKVESQLFRCLVMET